MRACTLGTRPGIESDDRFGREALTTAAEQYQSRATNILAHVIGASGWDNHHWTGNGRLAPLLSIVSYVPLSDSSLQTISLL
ncbi:uncharacterized protein N7446_013401 [Penicillium canescens]|uniref:uncharacterized protein n=1 Tax=Penicillium canescens TaxID=5083 RepID=UPI0026DF2415|nr:uncharacterized protein N7446_013401 [Penicillium canescens]KAJ6042335.1 hypothetical protein N7446_013401 [Penicillium canescens]